MIANVAIFYNLQFGGELKVIFSDAWINCCVLSLIMVTWITNVPLSWSINLAKICDFSDSVSYVLAKFVTKVKWWYCVTSSNVSAVWSPFILRDNNSGDPRPLAFSLATCCPCRLLIGWEGPVFVTIIRRDNTIVNIFIISSYLIYHHLETPAQHHTTNSPHTSQFLFLSLA